MMSASHLGSAAMLFDPARHEPLLAAAWDPQRARAAIDWIIGDAEATCPTDSYWPLHPKDLEPGREPQQPSTELYFGAAGVIWAIRYLRAVGAVTGGAARQWDLEQLRERHRSALLAQGSHDFGAYLVGELPIEMMRWEDGAGEAAAARIAALIDDNIDHPARELMWGSPGALLAASFLHERSGEARWAEAYRRIAARLREQLLWSEEHGCHYWTQDMYGRRSTYLGAVHGFVATAFALIRGRHLLGPPDWQFWQQCIAGTVTRTASRAGELANWRPELDEPSHRPPKMLVQFCHGAPGFVICLAAFPATNSTICSSPPARPSGPPGRWRRDRTCAKAPPATATRS